MVRTCLMAIVAFLAAGYSASAQYNEMADGSVQKDTISATGAVTVKRLPSAMRMYVELTGKGKTLEAALKNLKERRTAAVAQLEKLDVQKDSIKIENPGLSKLEAAKKKQFEMLVARRMSGRGGKTPKGLKAPESVVVSSMLTAEWALDAKTPDDLLLASQTLEEKIKAAKISGPKEEEEASPEEQEMMEEMMRNNGEEMPSPGAPIFVFVAKITPADREKATAEAFAKAKTQAEELAKIAGVKVGSLTALKATGGGEFNPGNDEMGYSSRMYMQRRMYNYGQDIESRLKESVGSDPNTLGFQFYVQAVFTMGVK